MAGSGTDTTSHFRGVLPEGPQPFRFWEKAVDESPIANTAPTINLLNAFTVCSPS